ncbi:hypothetical protein [Amycolatopsis sp. NPDC049868]|uniref:hypothetical protein n=1 Tax=Amycolatopsis sp. NPDC049868 TaxID=3363934 RepID=UPI00378796D9
MARKAVHSQPEGGVPGWVSPMLASPDGGRLREGPEYCRSEPIRLKLPRPGIAPSVPPTTVSNSVAIVSRVS